MLRGEKAVVGTVRASPSCGHMGSTAAAAAVGSASQQQQTDLCCAGVHTYVLIDRHIHVSAANVPLRVHARHTCLSTAWQV